MDLDTDNSAAENSGDQTAVNAEVTPESEAASIASSGGGVNWSDDDITTQSTEAPDDGNSATDDKSEANPANGQPEGDGADKDEKTEGDEAKADEAGATDGDTPTEEELQKAADAEEADMRRAAGLDPVKGDDQYDSINAKYVASSKEAHRLEDEAQAKAAALADVGVHIIKKPDGTYGVAPTEGYAEKLDVSAETRAIFETLPKDMSDKIDGDEAKAQIIEHVAKEMHKNVMSRRPSVNASQDDVRLDDRVVDNIFTELTQVQLGEGDNARPFYADMGEPKVVNMMLEHYDNPVARDFLIAANKSPENMKWFLDSCHAKVFRGRAPFLAAQKDAENQANKAKDEKREEASIGTGGDAGGGQGVAKGEGTNDEAHDIASSGGGVNW